MLLFGLLFCGGINAMENPKDYYTKNPQLLASPIKGDFDDFSMAQKRTVLQGLQLPPASTILKNVVEPPPNEKKQIYQEQLNWLVRTLNPNIIPDNLDAILLPVRDLVLEDALIAAWQHQSETYQLIITQLNIHLLVYGNTDINTTDSKKTYFDLAEKYLSVDKHFRKNDTISDTMNGVTVTGLAFHHEYYPYWWQSVLILNDGKNVKITFYKLEGQSEPLSHPIESSLPNPV